MTGRLELHTPHLRLLALALADLDLLLVDPARLENSLGLPISRKVLTPPVMGALRIKAMKMSGVPQRDHPWYTYWLVVVAEIPFGAGLAGFKGAPNYLGEVEIGYGIDPDYQRKGYTTEAVRALLDWGFAQPGCRVITAETHRDNPASIRVLQKVGMQVYVESELSYFWQIPNPRPLPDTGRGDTPNPRPLASGVLRDPDTGRGEMPDPRPLPDTGRGEMPDPQPLPDTGRGDIPDPRPLPCEGRGEE